MRIRILTTGGSIDKNYATQVSDFVVGAPQIERLLAPANVTYVLEEVCRKDSLEITDIERADLLARVQAAPESHILVTHGTDTMIQTARWLARVPNKVIVLTGAMQPAAFIHSDAPLNVGTALGALQLCPPGVYIAMNGRVFPWDKTRKNFSTDQFEETST